jgi:hypothetical protein
MVSSKMLTAAPKQPSVTDLDARCSSTCQIHQGMWRQVDERDPLSPTTPLEQRFQMFQPRLAFIKPRPKASRIVHDFEQEVVHLRISAWVGLVTVPALFLVTRIMSSVWFIAI